MVGPMEIGLVGVLGSVFSVVFFIWGVTLVWRIAKATERIANALERRSGELR